MDPAYSLQYRRDFGQPYEVDYFALDLLYQAQKEPEFLSVGGNTNGPNTFTGVSLGDFTGGVFDTSNLLQGNNLACFGYQAAKEATPDVALVALTDLVDPLDNILDRLSCPRLSQFDNSQLQSFPGYTRKS